MPNINFKFDRAGGLISPARFVPSPNCDRRPPPFSQIDMIIIHSISLPPRCYGGKYVEQFFTNKLNPGAHPYFAGIIDMKVSAHFFINRAGRLVQFVPTHLRAWHAGKSKAYGRENINDMSLGVELEGCDDEPFTDKQYVKLIALIDFLRGIYPLIIPLHILGHNEIAVGRKTDPGPYFDWKRVRLAIDEQNHANPYADPEFNPDRYDEFGARR